MRRGLAPVVDGILVGSAQIAGGELASALVRGTQSPLSAVGRVVIDRMPGPAVDMVVATARTADKPLLRSTLATAMLGAGVAATGLGRRGAAALGVLGVAVGSAAATRRDTRSASTLTAGTAGGMSGAVTLTLLTRSRRHRSHVAVATALAAAVAVVRRRAEHERLIARRAAMTLPPAATPAPPLATGASLQVPGLTPLFTPPEDFYVTDVQMPTPHADPDAWRLRVHGMVDRDLSLSLDELLQLPLCELDATLVCVHNPVGGERIGSARWLGVPLLFLLERAGVQPDAEQVIARSVDGFTAGIPVAHLRAGHPGLLAVGLNGEPLPLANGFPARLLVPGLWGADASTKWVAELEVTTWGAIRDYWDRRGWPRVPSPVKPGSRIDVPANHATIRPGPTIIAGVAWAPPGGVLAVEVSIDHGPWQSAQLSDQVAPTMWRQWQLEWNATRGPHEMRVRAVGAHGVQEGMVAPPYPLGSSGYHRRRVRVAQGGRRRLARAALDDAVDRVGLAGRALPAWRRRGYPPPPRFPAPV